MLPTSWSDRPSAPELELLEEYLGATRASLLALDPRRFVRLRACIDEARRWGELATLQAFWAGRAAPPAAGKLTWLDAPAGTPLAPSPGRLLAAAATADRLEATQQHAALPPPRLELLFDPSRPACHGWAERRLDLALRARLVAARDVLAHLPAQLDPARRTSIAEWIDDRRHRDAAPPNDRAAAALFELWARRYVDEWRPRIVAELEPLAARDAQLAVISE